MNKHVFLFLLFLVVYVQNTEKVISSSDDGYEMCLELETNDDSKYKCLFSPNSKGCKEKSCEDFKPNCEQFPADYDSKWIMKSDNTGCTLSKCGDMDIQKYGEFIPDDYQNKCTAVGNACFVIAKECKNYGVNECPKIADPEYNCFPDLDQKLCVSKKCEDLASTECDKYTSFDNSKKCLPEGKKCKLKTCEDLTVSEWESLVFDDNGLKCIVENTTCKLSNFYESTGACESFIPYIPISYCKEDLYSGDCALYSKKCEEMPNDLEIIKFLLECQDARKIPGKKFQDWHFPGIYI